MGVLTTVYAVDKNKKAVQQLVRQISYEGASQIIVDSLGFGKDWEEIEYLLKGILPKKDWYFKELHKRWAIEISSIDGQIYSAYYHPGHIVRTLAEYRSVVCEVIFSSFPEARSLYQTEFKDKVYNVNVAQMTTEEILTRGSFDATKDFLSRYALERHAKKRITNYEGDAFGGSDLERIVALLVAFMDLCYKAMANDWQLIRISA